MPVLLLALLGVLLIDAGPAQAQYPAEVLAVSNADQQSNMLTSGDLRWDHVQAFTTGDRVGGYMLTRAEISATLTSGSGFRYNVGIYETDGDGILNIDRKIGDLQRPQLTAEGGAVAFTASGGGLHLQPNQQYAFVYDVTNPGSAQGSIVLTMSSGEDRGSLSGWSLDERPDGASMLMSIFVKDFTAPELREATVNSDVVTLTYDEPLNAASVPSPSMFTLAGTNATVSRVSVRGDQVELRLSRPVQTGESLQVSYVFPEVKAFSNTQRRSTQRIEFNGEHAQAFNTGEDEEGYTLTGADILMSHVGGTGNPSYAVSIHLDNGGVPGTSLGVLNNPGLVEGTIDVRFTAPVAGIRLAPNNKYWLVWTGSGANSSFIWATPDNALDGGGLDNWDITGQRFYVGPDGLWHEYRQDLGGRPELGEQQRLMIGIHVADSSHEFIEDLAGNWAAQFDGRAVTRTTVTPREVIAVSNARLAAAPDDDLAMDHIQEFSTGGNSDGYTLTQIDVNVAVTSGSVGGHRASILEIWWNDGFPIPRHDRKVGDLIVPSLPTGSGTLSFTAPEGGLHLDPGTRYVLLYDITDQGDLAGTIERTTDKGQEAGALPGWGIFDIAGKQPPAGGGWERVENPLRITVFALEVTRPALETAAAHPDSHGRPGRVIALTYDEPLNSGSTPPASAFTLGGTSVTVTHVSVRGNQVLLMLSGMLDADAAPPVTVSYAVPGANPIEDALGNDAAALTDQAVTHSEQVAREFLAITNLGQPGDVDFPMGRDLMQRFRTGDDPNGYRLTSVDLGIAAPDGNEPDYTVSIHQSVQRGGQFPGQVPGARVGQPLVNPATLPGSEGVVTFTARGDGIRLEPNRWYILVWEVKAPNGATGRVSGTTSDVWDSGASSGWRIEGQSRGKSYNGDFWGFNANAIKLAVHLRDTTAPTAVSAAVNGDTLTITFSEPLDEAAVPATSTFALLGTTSTRPSVVAISGKTVTLTLPDPVQHWESPSVVYSRAASGVQLQDPIGNEVISFTPALVNDTPPPDHTPPELQRATVNGATLTLTYNEPLTEASATNPPNFDVTQSTGDFFGRRIFVSRVTVSDTTVTLVLASAVLEGATVTIAYSGGDSSFTIEDRSNNPAPQFGQFGGYSVENLTDTTPPALVRVYAANTGSGVSVRLTYDEDLDAGSAPASDDFTTWVGGAQVAATELLVHGNMVSLRLDPAVAITDGQAVRLSYTAGDNPLRDAAGTNAAAIAARQIDVRAVSNTEQDVSSTEQAFIAERHAQAFTTGNHVNGYTLTGAELAVSSEHELPGGAYTVHIHKDNNGAPGDSLGSLDRPDTLPEDGNAAYTAPGDGIRLERETKYWLVWTFTAYSAVLGVIDVTESDSVDSDSLAGWGVTGQRLRESGGAWVSQTGSLAIGIYVQDRTGPGLSEATAQGNTLTLSYDEPLNTGSTPPAEQFTLGGSSTTVERVLLRGNQVILLLSATLDSDTATVSYAVPSSNPIEDLAGNDAAALNAQAVTRTDMTSLTVLAVSNLEVTGDSEFSLARDVTTSFFTGSHPEGYTLSGVEMSLSTEGGAEPSYQVGIFTADDDGQRPVDIVGQFLRNPASLPTSEGTVFFAAQGDPIRLNPGTRYMLVWDVTDPSGATGKVFATSNGREDDGKAPGWGIGGLSRHRGHDETFWEWGGGNPMRMGIHVTEFTAPILQSAEVDGVALTLTFDELLDESSTPPASAFSVTVRGTTATVDSVAVRGFVVTLTLSEAVVVGDAVTVAYTRPDTGATLRDHPVGNEVATFAPQNATGPPSLVSIERHDGTNPLPEITNADSLSFRVTFSEPVIGVDARDFVTTLRGARFTVSGGGATYQVTLESSSVLPSFNGRVQISLASAGGGITDIAGNPLTSDRPTGDDHQTYTLENIQPTVVSVERHDGANPLAEVTRADSLSFRVTFDEPVMGVDADGSDFAASGVTGETIAVSGAGTTYQVTVSGGDLAGYDGRVELSLSGRQDITDEVGNRLTATRPSGSNEGYWLDNTPPSLHEARALGSTLRLTFTERLDGASVPAVGAFSVTLSDGSAGPTPESVSIAGREVALTLAMALDPGQTYTVSYAKPGTNPVQDPLGNEAGSFTSRSVIIDTGRVLISNLEQTTGDPTTLSPGNVGRIFQGFTTGSNPGGYVMASVDIPGGTFAGLTTTRGGNPETITSLDAGGTYYVVLSTFTPDEIKFTASDDEDGGGATGWSIEDGAQFTLAGFEGLNDYPRGESLQLAIRGTARPTSADNTVETDERTTYTFNTDDFSYADADGDTMAGVRITTLETDGALQLDGVDVIANQFITRSDLDANLLTFTPSGGESGRPYATFGFRVNDGLADSGAAYTMTVNVNDTTAPTFASARVNGTTLTITFSEDLAPAANLSNTAFTVRKTPDGGSEENVSLSALTAPAISGRTVTLTLAKEVSAFDTRVTVSYSKPDTGTNNKLQDPSDNEVASFTNQPVDNELDVRPPTVDSARVNGATLTITFDKSLAAAVPPAASFTVKKTRGGSEVDVPLSTSTAPAINGRTVTLTLATPVSDSDTDSGVKVSYSKPGTGNKLQDFAGNEVASFTDQPVENDTDSTAPTVTSATVNGATLTITFNEDLASAANLANTAFTVRKTPDGGSEEAVPLSATAPAISGETVTLTLATAVEHTDTDVKVSYDKPATGTNNKLQDAADNEVESFTDQQVDNDTPDTTAPTVTSAEVDGATLTITLSEDLVAAANLANGAFTVKKTPRGGSEETVPLSASTAPAISGRTVTLTLATAVSHTDTGVKVSYDEPDTGTNNKLQDAAGNEVADFTDQDVTNNTPDTIAPSVTSAKVFGSTLRITFNEDLTTASSLSNTAFSVKKTPDGGSEETVPLSPTPPAISGRTVTLTLATAVTNTDAGVKVSYSKPGPGANNKLRDAAGNEVASFSDRSVSLNTLALSVDADTATNGVQTSLAEDGGRKTVEVTATLSQTFGAAVSVTVEVGKSGDSATEGTDYSTVADQTITIPANTRSASTTFTLTPTNDNIDEPGETIALATASGGEASITLTDDDTAPTVTLSLNPTVVSENGGVTMVTASLNHPSSESTSVTVSVAPSARVTLSTNKVLTIAAGQTTSTGTVTLTAVDNSDLGANPAVSVSATAVNTLDVEGPDDVSLTITDDEDSAPTASDGEVTTREDMAYTFSAGDFNFVGSGSRSLASVKITMLESAGALTLDGADVTVNQVITKVDIDADKLVFTPARDANGDPYATFQFKVNDGVQDSAAAYRMAVVVTPINDGPTVANRIPNQAATLGQPFSYRFPENTFHDVDGDRLGYTAVEDGSTSLPSWLTFTEATRTFSGTPGSTVTVRLTADDGNGASVSLDFDITVSASQVEAPTFVSAEVNGMQLVITFSEDLAAAANLANGAFTVKKTPDGGSEEIVPLSTSTAPAISGQTVTLTLAAAVSDTDTRVTVSYVKPTTGTNNKLQDAAGHETASFTDKPVTNVRAPTITSAMPGDRLIALRWNPPSNPGGETIRWYDVRFKLTIDTTQLWLMRYRVGSADCTTCQYTVDDALVNGLSFDFQVRAVYASGDGPWSASVSSTPAQPALSTPIVTIAGPASSVAEDGTMTFTLTRTMATTDALTVSVSVTETGAMLPATTPTTATFATSQAITFLSLDLPGDTVPEPDSVVTVTVQPDSGYTVGRPAAATATAIDDDGDDEEVPGVPTGVSATAGDARVEVSWTAPTNAGTSTITRYDVRHIAGDASDKSDANWTVVDGGSASPHTVTGLTNGQEYDFQVRAVSAAGSGAWTATVTATPAPPPVALPAVSVTGPSASVAEDGTMVFTLTRTEDTTDALTVTVAVTESGAMLPSSLPTTVTFAANSATASVSLNLPGDVVDEPDSVVTVTVQAGSDYNVGTPAAATGTATDDDTVPGVPTGVAATAGDTQVEVSWTAPTNAGTSAITRYDVRHIESDASDKSDGNWTVVNGGSASPHTVTGLTNSTVYDFQVRAVSAAGPGAWTATVTAVPADPTLPAVSVTGPSAGVAEDGTMVFTLTRTEATTDALTVNVRVTETGDMLPSRPPITMTATFSAGSATATVSLNLPGDVVDEPDSVVTVAVRAGDGYSVGTPASATGTATDNDEVPGVPTGVGATEGHEEIAVSWTAPANAGTSPITRYDVRHIASDAPDKSDGSWTVVNGGSASPHTVTRLTNAQEYDFQVRAVSAAGPGAWTATVTATPAAPTVSIAGPGADVPEDGTMTFTLTRTGATTAALTATIAVSETGAMLPGNLPTTATFAAGSATATVSLNLPGDLVDEPDSVVTVTIQAGSGYNVGTPSSATGTATDDDEAPGVPTGVAATAGNARVRVSWTAPTNAGTSAITRYEVRHIASDASDKSDGNWTVVNGGPASPHTVTGLTNGQEYDFQVRALSAAGMGDWTTTATATPDSSLTTPFSNVMLLSLEADDGYGWRDLSYSPCRSEQQCGWNWTPRDIVAEIRGGETYGLTVVPDGALSYPLRVSMRSTATASGDAVPVPLPSRGWEIGEHEVQRQYVFSILHQDAEDIGTTYKMNLWPVELLPDGTERKLTKTTVWLRVIGP